MKNLTLKQITRLVLKQASSKGFGTKPEEINVAEKIALIHSEISEAYIAYRRKNLTGKAGLAEELGDSVQRILHLAGVLKIDLEKEILKKIKSNKSRNWDWQNLNETHA
ncbi:MAG: hypothetical protein WC768_01945 [Patescibacteria group bacterium]|jgi:NTP pyrophosphatase (non-canonical NTP hydrolase)